MDYKKPGIIKHKHCIPCMSDINKKLLACKISNNKNSEFIIDNINFTILNLSKKTISHQSKKHMEKER